MGLHDDGLISLGEFAQRLGVSRRTVRRLVRAGTIAAPADAVNERFNPASYSTILGYSPAQRLANGISDADPIGN